MATKTRFKPFLPDVIAGVFPSVLFAFNSLRSGVIEETLPEVPYFGLVMFYGPLIATMIAGLALIYGRKPGIIFNLVYWLLLAGFAISAHLPATFGHFMFHALWIYSWLRLTGLISPPKVAEAVPGE